jgi:hypothetical protein
MLEGLESGDDSRLRLELVRGLLFSSSFSAISLNVAKRMGEKKVFSLSISLLMLGFTLFNNTISTIKVFLLTTKVIQQLLVIR